MILCVDIGNTRIKWARGALHSAGWLETGLCTHDVLDDLKEQASRLGEQGQIWVSNVAGAARAEALCAALSTWSGSLFFAKSAATCAGVNNLYAVPESLGVDRWCSLIAAHQLQLAERASPILVVSLGTATTIDALDATGDFLGGMILPGVVLMRDSLAQRTAQLPWVETEASADRPSSFKWPRSTDQAIQTGVIEATVGAITRARQQLLEQLGAIPVCVLTGGAAQAIRGRLPFAALHQPQLVLDGLRCMARVAR